MDNPKEPPKNQDISYTLMPDMARKNMPAPPPEPVRIAPLPSNPPARSSSTASNYSSASVKTFRLSRRQLFFIGGALLLLVLAISVYLMVKNASDRAKQPQVIQTKLPKVWLNQHFATEACTDAKSCADDADPDSDGLSNYNEFKEGANPGLNDTDQDGLADGDEVNIYKTDPTLKYTDRRDIAVTNDYNDAVSIVNQYDPLTPGIKMIAARIQQIADDTAKYQVHEPTITTLQQLKPGAAPTAKTVSLFIENGKFNPENLVVNKGDTVVWLNKDESKHMIVSSDLAGLTSPELTNNQTYSFKFETVGIYEYHDRLNPEIKGTVEVK